MDEESNLAMEPAFDLAHLSRYFSERSPQPMLAVEGMGHVVRYANQAFMRLAGAAPGELIGLPFTLAVPEGLGNRCISLLDRVYHTGTFESLVEQKHGQMPTTYWSYVAWAILGSNQRPVGVMMQVTDSTEATVFRSQSQAMNESLLLSSIRQHELTEAADLRNTRLNTRLDAREAEMAQLSRVITMEHLASGLAHELSQPLGAIGNYAGACLLQNKSPVELPASVLTAIREILNEANRAGAIISHVRSFLCKQQPGRVLLDMNQLVHGSVHMVESELQRRQIRPVFELAANLPKVLGDAVGIEQVLINLLLNALQAMSESVSAGNRLTVKTALHDEGHSVQVWVIDTGPGVLPEDMGRLFEPFFTTKPQGLGMGLNICRSIIESQGGELRAVTNTDRGMRFCFTVPVAEP